VIAVTRDGEWDLIEDSEVPREVLILLRVDGYDRVETTKDLHYVAYEEYRR